MLSYEREWDGPTVISDQGKKRDDCEIMRRIKKLEANDSVNGRRILTSSSVQRGGLDANSFGLLLLIFLQLVNLVTVIDRSRDSCGKVEDCRVVELIIR